MQRLRGRHREPQQVGRRLLASNAKALPHADLVVGSRYPGTLLRVPASRLRAIERLIQKSDPANPKEINGTLASSVVDFSLVGLNRSPVVVLDLVRLDDAPVAL